MLNTIVSAFIAIFFWGKVTKETEEKTRCASWLRVAIYGVLTIPVIIFFYKTYQVATIYNMVQVDPLRTCYDERDSCVDFIDNVTFYTRFSGDGTYRNKLINLQRQYGGHGEVFAQYGGVVCEVIMSSSGPSQTRWAPSLSPQEIQNLSNIPGVQHMYDFAFSSNQLPSLLPFAPYWQWTENEWKRIDTNYEIYQRTKAEPFRDNDQMVLRLPKEITLDERDLQMPMSFDLFGDGTLVHEAFYDRVPPSAYKEADGFSLLMTAAGFKVNTMNFFTAADVSQFTYNICVTSPLPVKRVVMMTDIPIEIDVQMDSIIIVPMGFDICSGLALELLQRGSLTLHIKLPTLANLQLIRSLILTTLLTALLSLFGMNLYYCLRRAAKNYRRRHPLSFVHVRQIRNRLKIFRITLYFIFFILVSLVGWWSWMLAIDRPILFDVSIVQDYHINYIIIAALLLLIILLILFHRWARTPPEQPTDEEMEDTDTEETPAIFIHEQSEEEEMDELFEGLPEDDMIALAEEEERQAEELRKKAEEEARQKAEEEMRVRQGTQANKEAQAEEEARAEEKDENEEADENEEDEESKITEETED